MFSNHLLFLITLSSHIIVLSEITDRAEGKYHLIDLLYKVALPSVNKFSKQPTYQGEKTGSIKVTQMFY